MPVNIQDVGAEISATMEGEGEELLSGQDQEDAGPMPLNQYLSLRFRLLKKSVSWNMCQVGFMAAGVLAVGILGVAALHSMKSSFSLRAHQSESLPQAHPSSVIVTATPVHQKPLACNYHKVAFCPAFTLFQSSDIHRVATDNVMRTSNRLLTQADYESVQEYAQAGFQKISIELKERAPEVAKELERVQFSNAQKNAVLDLLALLNDPSVQSVGFDVAMIIRKSKFFTKKFLKFYIEDSLNPIDEIQKLANEIVPKSVRELWGKGGHDWELTLDPRNIRSMRMDHHKMLANLTDMDYETKSLSIYIAVLQVGRVLLDIMKIQIRTTVPSWSTTLSDTIELLFKGIALPTDSNKLAYIEAFLWPLKCGAQGLDALRASVSQEYGHEFKR